MFHSSTPFFLFVWVGVEAGDVVDGGLGTEEDFGGRRIGTKQENYVVRERKGRVKKVRKFNTWHKKSTSTADGVVDTEGGWMERNGGKCARKYRERTGWKQDRRRIKTTKARKSTKQHGNRRRGFVLPDVRCNTLQTAD